MTIRVLIADDHPIVRSGIQNELSRQADIDVVGEAETGDEVLPLIRELQPTVLVLDINMPGMKAAQILRELSADDRSPSVLILTAYGDPENVLGMLKAGAKGYLLKDSSPGEIAEAIRAAAEGRSWLSPSVTGLLMAGQENANDLLTEAGMTAREVEVLQLVAQGYNNAQIAERLAISEGTVKNHVANLYDKLGFHTRAEAVAWAWQHRLTNT